MGVLASSRPVPGVLETLKELVSEHFFIITHIFILTIKYVTDINEGNAISVPRFQLCISGLYKNGEISTIFVLFKGQTDKVLCKNAKT